MSLFWCFVIAMGAFLAGGGIVALFEYLYRIVVKEYWDAC